MIIKKWNSTNTTWEEQYPKTLHTMLYDANATTTTLFDASNKLKVNYLPDAVFGGMTLVGTLSISGGTSSPLQLKTLITGTTTAGYSVSSTLDAYTTLTYPNGYDDIGKRYIGHYWVVTQSLSVFDETTNSEAADWQTAAFDDGVAPYLAGGLYADNLPLEAGDWVIITGWDNTNNTFLFNIISNTMSDATTATKGVVELATDAEVTTGTSTNLIPSVKQLKDNYAVKTHTHEEDEIDASKTWTYLNNGVGDSLTQVIDLIDADLSAKATSISTNATNITNLAARKILFVEEDAPTANQNNDIWFDI